MMMMMKLNKKIKIAKNYKSFMNKKRTQMKMI